MKKLFSLLSMTLMTVLAWGQSPVVKVEGGLVQGVPSASSNVTVFRGIPYAAPPVGNLRWKRPHPVVKWEGVKKADTFSNICWQPGNAVGTFYGNEFYWKEQTTQSEDCLYLNIWTPAKAVGRKECKLPVAFWVHGGAYFNGYGHEITMDGDAWANRDVILVTINYRLGIFGFLAHPELSAETKDGTSGNYGTYDQVAALKWVYENIAQFGGDPNNITVLGQSAGAASIKNLVSSPMSKSMIRNAVIQSGGGIGAFGSSDNGQKQAETTGKTFMDKFGYSTLKQMRNAPAEELLRIFKTEGMGLFRPHIDGILLTESFDDAAKNQHLADASYMIGCTLDDIRPMGKQIDEFCFLRDSLDHRPAYQYLFARKLPGTHDGAFHSAELWYMFHTLDRSWRPMTDADYRLADEVMDCWTNFVKYGNPNKPGSKDWQPFTLANPYVKTFNVKQEAHSINTNMKMTKEQLRQSIVMALEDMKAKAIEMGIQGVATASVLNKGEEDDWIGEMKVVGKPYNQEKGHNLVAIAWSKCGEVIATQADSGNPDHQKMMGELGFVGGAYDEYEGFKMAFAFSGAISEDDLIVSKYGIEKLKGYLSNHLESDTTTTYKSLSTPLKKDQFIQITIVVDDIRRAAQAWAALLNVPVPEIWTNHLKSNGEYPYTYRGKDIPCDLQMCVFDMGNWALELHQIDGEPSTFREFQNKHGQGVHHVGFEVGDARDEIIRELKEMGFDTERTIGIYPGSSWTIVDTEDVLGVNLNIKPKR